MSDYAHIATDLVNAARAETDERQKDLILRQIREVALHRDPSTIPLVLKDTLDMAVGAKTSTVVFLVRLAGECLRKDYSQLPVVLASYSFLMTQESDRVHHEVAAELTKGYSKAALAVAEMFSAADANETGLKHSWKQLRGVATKLVDKVSSNRASEQLRTAGVALAENVVLFGLPAPVQKADPRRRRAAGPAADSSSVANLTSMHPFILDVKAELEKEAEDIFSKLVLWAYQGGPQGSPFTPAQMALLAQAIASIAGQRHLRADGSDRDEPRSSKATKALQVLLKGKKSVCKDMAGADRKALVLAMHRFVGTSPPDPTSDLPKLREAIADLEGLGFAGPADKALAGKGAKKAAAAKDTGTKRKAADMQAAEGEEVEVGVDDEEALQAEARRMLDESESQLKRAKTEASAAAASAAPSSGALAAETELSADLAPEIEDAAVSLSKISQHKASTRGTGIEYTIVPLTVGSAQVANLAAATLQRLLGSFHALKAEGVKACESHAKMAVRTVLSQTAMQLQADTENSTSSQVKVPIFSLIPATVDRALLADIPVEVNLPRPVWQLLSFVLRTSNDDPTTHVRARQASLLAAVRDKLGILVLLLKELRMQADAGSEHEHAAIIYDDLVLVLLSRLLQNWNLREVTRPLFTALPRVPPTCVQLLKLLMHTGTKPSAAAASVAGVGRPGKEARQRGTRQEAMGLLGGLVAAADEEAGKAALHHLLWCSVSSDFEVRGKAVALLVNEVIHSGNWAYSEITSFALQAAAQLVGTEGIAARAGAVYEARELQWGALEKAAAATAEKDKERERTEADMQLAGGDMMVVEEEEEAPAPSQGMSLAASLEDYDSGAYFGGSFPTSLALPSLGDDSSAQAHTHRCVQLLAQVCASDPSLLGAFVDLTAALAAKAGLTTPADVTAAAVEAVAAAKAAKDAAVDPAEEPATPSALTPRQRFDAVLLALREDLANVLPAVVATHPTEAIFEALARADPLGRPLLTYAMEVLHSDVYVPATPECIRAVAGYLRASFGVSPAEAPAEPEAEGAFLLKLSGDELRFCLPLLGGLQRAAAEPVLPKILRLLMPTPDVLNRAISRLTLGQPPVLSKAQFLTFLHRLNEDDKSGQGLDKTQLKDAIGLCLDREDFDGEVVREVLFNLVEDTHLSLYLVRTGILSARKYKEVRKFLLQETVPKLIRRRVWTARDENSGKFPVWEGVVQCVRYFCDSKDSEQMLRCVLSLDGPRLAVVMKVAPKVPAILAKLLKTLSTKEREDVVSGRWAGIAGERGKVDSEKKKIVESLQALKL